MAMPKPNYLLEITADMEFVESLAPQAGCDDPDFYYNFSLRCKKCKKDIWYQLCRNLKSGPFEKPCEYCGEPGSVTLVPGFGKPLTAECANESKYSPLMAFEIKGYEPVDFSFESGWKVESVNGTVSNNVDLTHDYWAKYKYRIPALISQLDYRFILLDNDDGGVNKNEDLKDEDTAHEDLKGEDTAHEDFKDDYTDEDEVDEGNNDFKQHRNLNSRYSEYLKHEDDAFEYDDYKDYSDDEEGEYYDDDDESDEE